MNKKVKSAGNLRKNVLSVGIAILFVLFVGYAIQTIMPGPDWDDFCGEFDRVPLNNQEECEANGGKWQDNVVKPVREGSVEGWCDQDFSCREEYDLVSEEYNLSVFFISLVIGLLTFVVAIFLLAEAVSVGFMGGGVLLILYGTIRYWGSLSDIWRTVMLGFALVILVYIGYKKLKD